MQRSRISPLSFGAKYLAGIFRREIYVHILSRTMLNSVRSTQSAFNESAQDCDILYVVAMQKEKVQEALISAMKRNALYPMAAILCRNTFAIQIAEYNAHLISSSICA